MEKLRTLTVVGTRPEIIRLARLIQKLDEHTQHLLVHTGQNHDPALNEVFFRDLELRSPDVYLEVDPSSFSTVMADTLVRVADVLTQFRPDAVLILGDTNSAIAAIASERLGIPVYHMEAGNRSFDLNVPEELNRRMVDHVASFNLPYNDYAMRNLLQEGIHPRRILKTGSPIGELFLHFKSKIEESQVLRTCAVEPNKFILASVHRQENVDKPHRLQQVLDCLRAVNEHFNMPILVSTHPRLRRRLADLNHEELPGVSFLEPFGYLDYAWLQMNSFCVVSDSGTISEEASIMKFPAVTLRDSMERPEALETGSILLTGLDPENVINSIRIVTTEDTKSLGVPQGYEILDFSNRVLNFVISTAKLHPKWANLID